MFDPWEKELISLRTKEPVKLQLKLSLLLPATPMKWTSLWAHVLGRGATWPPRSWTRAWIKITSRRTSWPISTVTDSSSGRWADVAWLEVHTDTHTHTYSICLCVYFICVWQEVNTYTKYIHTQTYTHKQLIHTHTYTHVHTLTLTYSIHTHLNTHIQTHSCIHTHTQNKLRANRKLSVILMVPSFLNVAVIASCC